MLENARNRIIRYPAGFLMRFRILWLKALGVKIGRRCWIRNISLPRNPWDIEIEDSVALDDDTVLLTTGARKKEPRIIVGEGTYINRFAMLDASDKIEIGSDCMIGPYCYITDHDHGFRKGVKIKEQELTGAAVAIGDDVWVGACAVILKGVKVGSGAVIGAGSVVTENVPEYAIVAGVPARQIGERK
ncbi:MAG: acyltransferase [Candidatus Omnitrophota bacterium]|jgi:acetyltransferase-like isoleucine patch superfamily enzyme